ncbi:MAG: hypothetical protein M1821_000100 [Bathelium mastoideum]|nr:MAG: hypothetical protein M1821_000100 [Bathelium mastoideum]
MAPSTRASRPKKQARLQFTPLPSSSPQSANYHAQIRDRAAAVTYEGSPSSNKRRRIIDDKRLPASRMDNSSGLATPKHTSQIQEIRSSSDSEPIRTSARKSTSKKGDRLEKGTPNRTRAHTAPSPAHHRRPGIGIFGSKNGRIDLSDGEENSSSVDESSKQPAKATSRRKGSANKAGQPLMAPGRRLTRSKALARSSDSESENDVHPPTKKPKYTVSHHLGEAETSGDEIVVNAKSRTSRSIGSSSLRKPRRRADGLDDFLVDDYGDEDSDVQVVSQKPRSNHAQVISDENEDQKAEDEDEDEDDDVPITPRKRKDSSKCNPRASHKVIQQEKEDLEEDLEFLQPSDDNKPFPSSRTRRGKPPTPKQSARTRALEVLKERRAGKQTAIADDEDVDDDAEMEKQNDQSVDLGDGCDSENLQGPADHGLSNGVLSSSAMAMFEEDEDDEGFITEDEEDVLGAPSSALPIQFSNYSSRKPKELFKFAIEWMVQKKFNPAFQMNDDVYRLTFDKLNDEVKGLVGSKFMSAAWTADFTRAVQARPQIEAYEISSSLMHDRCDACNRSGHPATWQVRFTGKPYHEETLEDVEQEHDDDDDDDDDNDDDNDSDDEDETSVVKVERDSKGHPLLSAKQTFRVGKFCMRNARIGHALAHWRYHLNEWVIDYLRDEGYLNPNQIVERDGWNVRRRREFANSVVDGMERMGEIKRLHRDYRTEIDSAREAKTEDRFVKF